MQRYPQGPPMGQPPPSMMTQQAMAGQGVQYRKRSNETDSLAKHIK